MRSMAWWSIWGLAMAVGVIGFLEISRNHYYLLLAAPLLAGALAAALHRVKYEYHHALEHAKWAGISTLFLLAGLGFLYAKAQAFGPFGTGSTHKAVLGTTFEMSVPEVERALGRSLGDHTLDHALHEKAHDWIWDALPLPSGRTHESYTVRASLLGARSEVTFQFKKKKLSRVELQFLPLRSKEAAELNAKIIAELSKDYTRSEESLQEGFTKIRFSKDPVEAGFVSGPGTDKLINTRVVLDYLPLDQPPAAPLAVESNVF